MTHRSIAGMLWVLVLLAPATAQAQDAEAAAWTDAEDDHEVGVTAGNQGDESEYTWQDGSATGWYPFADLTGAVIDEPTATDLRVRVRVAALDHQGTEPHPVDYLMVDVRFGFHGQDRVVQFVYRTEDGAAVARLRTLEDDRWRIDRAYPAAPLEDGPGWSVTFAKIDLVDADLVPARAGDVLTDVRVRSVTQLTSTVSPCVMRSGTPDCWKARDALGEGEALGAYTIQRAPATVGHLEVTCRTPVRSSNGLATTYMFQLVVHNLADTPDRALLSLGPTPPDWTVHLPHVVELPPGGRVEVPVAVGVPFTHLHGNATFINVTAQSERDPGVEATQALGVVWTEIPQPAGHHNLLHLHARDGTEWMNTLEADPDADPEATVPPFYYSASFGLDTADYEFQWRVPLSPVLQSGLDFVVGGPVRAELTFDFPVEAEPDARVRVYTADPTEEHVVIGTGNASLGAGDGRRTFEFAFDAVPEADRIPYARDANLMLEATVAFTEEGFRTGLGAEPDPRPLLVAEAGRLALPLVEFVELPDQALLGSLTRLHLEPLTETSKQANPGRTAAFGFRVENEDDDADTLEWSLLGANTAWARVDPAASRVPGGGNATVTVAVVAPEDAVEGEHARLLLVGQSTRDAAAQVYAHLLLQVTTQRDIPSEDDLADRLRDEADRGAAGAPGPAAAMLLLGILALLAGRRRR